MSVDWLTKLGKTGFELLIRDSVEKAVDSKVEPRFKAIESELRALRNGQKALENRLAEVESRIVAVQTSIDTLAV